jgi:toxin secretion/phage lysis holin
MKIRILIEGIFSAALATIAAYLGELAIPIIVLLLALVADYTTGMVKAWINAELSSRIGIKGIVKKLCYLLVVCAGMVVDWILIDGLDNFGINYIAAFSFGATVCIWLIINEIVSILENLSAIGVPMPSFLLSAIKRLKIAIENKGDSENE